MDTRRFCALSCSKTPDNVIWWVKRGIKKQLKQQLKAALTGRGADLVAHTNDTAGAIFPPRRNGCSSRVSGALLGVGVWYGALCVVSRHIRPARGTSSIWSLSGSQDVGITLCKSQLPATREC